MLDTRDLDVRLFGIGNGTAEQLRNFKTQFEIKFEIYTDPSLRCYRFFNMKRKLGLGLRAVARYLKAMWAGHRQGWMQGDGLQQGGVVLVDGELNTVWAHVNNGPGDHANFDDLAEAVARFI